MSQTYSEIMNTPDALQQTLAYLDREWPAIARYLSGKKRFVFLGCGSSFSLARSMSVMTQMHTGLFSVALAAGDLLLHAPRYAGILQDAAVICISRSGHTSEINMALDAIKPFGAAPAAMVCAGGTPLEERCELTLNMPWAFDESVCQTRTVTNFYFAAAYILARQLANQALLDELTYIAGNCREYLLDVERLARDMAEHPWTHCVVLADAELEGIADEGALAFKEICQLPSNYYHLLDARHGPLVLLGEKNLVLAALGVPHEMEYNLLRDIKNKGAQVVAFSDDCAGPDGIIFSCFGRPLSHIAKGIPFIILCQMISYYKSKVTGANPDKPTGLDPWISL